MSNNNIIAGFDDEKDEIEEELRCPECNGVIDETMEECPHCGVGLAFEYE